MPDPKGRSLPDQGGRDHWLCPGCGTFDGPISYRRCDACEDRPEVRAMGYVGGGTPHARMEATWKRMEQHEADVMRLTDWTPVSSRRALEWSYVDAFEALRAENERLREAADEAITTLALLRGYVEPGEAWDSEPWLAINAAIRRLMQATGAKTAPASDEEKAT